MLMSFVKQFHRLHFKTTRITEISSQNVMQFHINAPFTNKNKQTNASVQPILEIRFKFFFSTQAHEIAD